LQSHAVLVALDLASIGRADGSQQVSVQDTGLEKVNAPRREVVLVKLVHRAFEAEVIEYACAHDALVANVVDCQYRTGSGEQPVPRVTRLQVKGDQRRVPVVAVKDVGR